jgi:RNA polymerase-binding protein DksA
MTMKDVQEVKKLLEERVQTLSAKVDEIEGDLREPANPDFAEQATEAEADEVLEGLESSALLEISQINAALARIEEGTYGECATCGEPVGEKRLEAIPHAAQCIGCASK